MKRRQLLWASLWATFAGASGSSLARAATSNSRLDSPISKKSAAWLQSKGWWPLQVHINPTWSDGNLVIAVMKENKLLEKRGVNVNYQSFAAASYANSAYIPGHMQVVQAGELGLYGVMALKVPTIAAIVYPAQLQAFMVPLDSPLKSLQDLKGQKVLKRPAVYGVTVGSTPDLGMQIAAGTWGLTVGTDYQVENLSPDDIITMPKGIDLVGIWEPLASQMANFTKNARILDLTGRYEIFSGYSYLRGEIAENAPDVVQAYVDAFVEAQIWSRQNQAAALALLGKQPLLKGANTALLRQQANLYNFWPKPTKNFMFTHTDGFWTDVAVYQSNYAHRVGELKVELTPESFPPVFRPEFLASTYRRLGWAQPGWPPFIPPGWKGVIGKPPYPAYYYNGLNYTGPQPFPSRGDLVDAWGAPRVAS